MKNRCIAISCALLFCIDASAGTVDPNLARLDVCGRYEALHINGIATSQADALLNLDALQTSFGNSHNEHLVRYGVAYNPTQGRVLDVVDVFASKLSEYPGVTYAMLVRAFLGRARPPITDALVNELEAILIERIRLTGYVSQSDADLARIVDSIRRIRAPGAKTLLIPHSQGSLYANSAYAQLTQPGAGHVPPQSIGILAVASVAGYVAGGNGRYTSSRRDLVVAALRKLVGGGQVLRPNVRVAVTVDDLRGHSFTQIYLRRDSAARAKILQDMAEMFDALRTDLPDPIPLLATDALWTARFTLPPPSDSTVCNTHDRIRWRDNWTHHPSSIDMDVPGSRAELEPLVTANLQACFAKAIAVHKAMLLGQTSTHLHSCSGQGISANSANYIAWQIHGADAVRTEYLEAWVSASCGIYAAPPNVQFSGLARFRGVCNR